MTQWVRLYIGRKTELNNRDILQLQIGPSLCYKLGQLSLLLQIGAAFFVITNWGSYYKLGQLLLQNRAAIANRGRTYYKLG